MSNPLYQQQMQNQNANNPMDQFQNFRSNPMQFLMGRGLNIPQQYANDPKGAVQYLVNNGQMSQGTLNALMQRAQMMGMRF
ncbi:MAG: hypothetical protein J6Y02_00910 [Pseudobutyrivibrio sp.]|nr:hypothetical protein [Pseudobutyrivibrio sp.]